MGARGPRNFLRDRAYSAQIFSNAGDAGLRNALSGNASGCEEKNQASHGGIVSEDWGTAGEILGTYIFCLLTERTSRRQSLELQGLLGLSKKIGGSSLGGE